MHPTAPHFLLYSETARAADAEQAAPSRWRFVLRDDAGQTALQAADDEDGATPERLELLAIVRALESLDQPSRVTLVTASRNVRRGLTYGLPLWSESGWQWERFGQMTPVKNGDLWRRIDRALEIHALDCRNGQIEQTDDLAAPPQPADPQPKVVTRRTRRGRVLRIDPAAGKSEIRSTKHETNLKRQCGNDRNASRFGHSFVQPWKLFRISSFVLRASTNVLRALARIRNLTRN
jgi:ribonuclease HI